MLVQIEVDSGNVETCRKLSLGLVDQLRLQRNHLDTINECRGFYLPPCGNRAGYVQEVMIKWNDSLLKFNVESKTVFLALTSVC